MRERLKKMYEMIHLVMNAVLERKISTQDVIDSMEKLLAEKEVPWWEEDDRYINKGKWILDVVTPELLYRMEDCNFTENVYWKKWAIPESFMQISKEAPHEFGAHIYEELWRTNLLGFTPSIEAFDFYEQKENEKLRLQYWDRTGNWVLAWRDMVMSKRHPYNFLIPAMKVNADGKVFRKSIPLHDIYKLKMKVIYRM